jgi:hypothetical protein
MAYMALVYEGLEDGPALVLARGIGGGQGCPPAMSILPRWGRGRAGLPVGTSGALPWGE